MRLRSDFENPELPMIFTFAQTARQLAADGADVISLEQGQADYSPPRAILDEAIRFIENEPIHYTTIDGTAALKDAIISKYRRENDLGVSAEGISVGTGGSQIIFEALAVTLHPGDEVVIPTPYWPSFVQGVVMNGGKPVFVPTKLEGAFKASAGDLERSISGKTKWIVVNSPGNPGGGSYTPEELHAIGEVLDRHPHVAIMFDEIYEHMTFDGARHANILNVRPDLSDRVLLINGASKSYSMTGWRIGYGCGPVSLARAMKLYRSASTSSPSALSQAATVAALGLPAADIENQMHQLERQRDLLVEALNRIPGIECIHPQGSMYVFPRCTGILGRKTASGSVLSTDVELCEYLVSDAQVCTVPGSAFGSPGHFRANFAVSRPLLLDAASRLSSAVAKLSD